MPESAEFDAALQTFVDLLQETILMLLRVPQPRLRLTDSSVEAPYVQSHKTNHNKIHGRWKQIPTPRFIGPFDV